MTRPILTPAALAKAERLREQGLTWATIAARLGCRPQTLANARLRLRQAVEVAPGVAASAGDPQPQ